MLLWTGSGPTDDRIRTPKTREERDREMSISANRASQDLIASRRRGAILILGYIIAVVGIVVLMAVMR